MTSRDFCYWLQGYFEIGAGDMGNALSGQQVDAIRRHLALVFKHEIDPGAGDEKHQAALDDIHSGNTLANKNPIGGTGPNGVLYRC